MPIWNDDRDSRFVDLLLEQNQEFLQMMEERAKQAKNGEVSTLEDVRTRLSRHWLYMEQERATLHPP
jgi:hypothetical protein